MLKYTRVIMYLLLSFVLYMNVPEGDLFLNSYVIASAGILLLNHFVIFSSKNIKVIYALILADALISFSFGFLFPGSTLYLILLGVVSVTLFIHISSQNLLRLSIGLFILLWVIVMVYWTRVNGALDFLDNLISVSFVAYGALVGDLIRKLLEARAMMDEQYEQLNASHVELTDAHQQLRIYSKQVEDLTTIRERNRIAREIHDTVGHKMTALLVQLDLARELLKLDIHKAEDTLVVCDELARGALQEIRFSVRTLHHDEGEQYTMVQSIRKLLEDFYQSAQLEAVFELTGDPVVVPISLQPTIIRIIQESLTNAKRHGAATSFLLKMDCSLERISLLTKDNGKGAYSIEPGFGLINMKERIEEHGGSLLFESVEGEGFQMKVLFPLLERKWISGGRK